MSQEKTQPGARIDSQLWERFRQDVQERRGGTRGHLATELENAIENYLDASKGGDNNDRLRRLENSVEDIAASVEALSEQVGQKKKHSSLSQTTKDRLRDIRAQINREAGDSDVVHQSVINKAIEDNAGSSEPTLKRYKEMLKQRRIVFEHPHPTKTSWFTEPELFVQYINESYEHPPDEIDVYGRDWFDQIKSEVLEESERGFQ